MPRQLIGVVVLAIVGLGLRAAQVKLWVCDDAFISFRYAQNLVEGRGLVFNAGEHVEGYTNFAWTMILALGERLGADPVALSQWLGIGFFAATIALLLVASRRVGGASFWLPIAALGYAMHEHAQVFASCGLETAMFAFLTTALLLALAWARTGAAFALAGALGTVLAMTRPDGLLLCAVGGLFAILRAARGSLPWRHIAALSLPGLVVYLPYFLWKWSYYGSIVPNTFYAKSADIAYPSQGLFYLRLFFQCYWVLIPAALALLWMALVPARRTGAASTQPDALPQLTLAFVLAYLAFVAWVGGDFMFARFAMPITPALYLGFELLRRRWPGAGVAIALAAFAVGGTLLPAYPEGLRAKGELRGIVEERTYYPADEVAHRRRCAEHLRELFLGHESRIGIGGAQAMIAYYGRFDLVIECATGLTDAYLARLPIPERTRVGHEKGASRDPAYLERRRIQFLLDTREKPPDAAGHDVIEFGPCWGRILTYDRDMMRHLRGKEGVRFVDCEAWIDSILPALASLPRAKVQEVYAMLRPYYFVPNDDPEREAPFKAILGN